MMPFVVGGRWAERKSFISASALWKRFLKTALEAAPFPCINTRRDREGMSPRVKLTPLHGCTVYGSSHLIPLLGPPQSPSNKPSTPGNSSDVSNEQSLHSARGWISLQWVKKNPNSWIQQKELQCLCVEYGKSHDFCPGLLQLWPGWIAQSSALLCAKCWCQHIP